MMHAQRPARSPSALPVRRLIALATLGALAGCASAPKGPISVFPPPPDVARFEYLRSFSDEEDLKTSGWDRFLRLLIPRPSWTTLNGPQGVGFSPDEKTLYVSASASARVIAIDLEKGNFTAFGNEGPDATKVVRPIGLAVDAAGNIYVADRNQNCVMIYGPDLKFRGAIKDPRLRQPSALAIDVPGQILYVVNDGERREGTQSVEAYSLTGQHLHTIGGGMGGAEGQFALPAGVAVSHKGEVYVADKLNFRVQVFDRAGKYQRKFGEAGTGLNFPGQFDKIQGLAFDSFDNIYVVDSMQGIQILNPDFQPLYSFNLNFQLPVNIAISSKNRIFITDHWANTVHELQLINTTAEDSFRKPPPAAKDAPKEAPKAAEPPKGAAEPPANP
jgi:sugar lactone lactonase YvrE